MTKCKKKPDGFLLLARLVVIYIKIIISLLESAFVWNGVQDLTRMKLVFTGRAAHLYTLKHNNLTSYWVKGYTGQRSRSHLVVTDLFGERLLVQLQQVVQMHLVLTNQSLNLVPLLLPLVAVTNHAFQLQKPRLHAVLCAVPLAADLLHWHTAEREERVSLSHTTDAFHMLLH